MGAQSRADLLKPIIAFVEMTCSSQSADDALSAMHDFYEYAPAASVSLSTSPEPALDVGWQQKAGAFLADTRLPLQISSNFARPLNDADLNALNALARVEISLDTASPSLLEQLHASICKR